MTTTTKTITKLIVALALFVDVLDGNILNTAVPAISHSLHVSPIDLKIALISYLLSHAIFIPASGWTADKYGEKSIFIGGIALYTVSSFFCGYAHTLVGLVIARFVQGIGGAFMVSLGRLIIVRTFHKHEMVQAMNFVITIVSVGVMIGPVIGGFIVYHWPWSWIFWVNIPVGIIVMVISLYQLKELAPREKRPFDFIGFILFSGSLVLLTFSFSQMSESHIDFIAILLRFMLGFVMLLLYVWYAKYRIHPLIDLRLFLIKTFRISVAGNLCGRLGFGGMPFVLPLFQQVALGMSAPLSGLLLIPMALGVMSAKTIAYQLLRKFGYRRYLLQNTLIVGVILMTYTLITKNTNLFLIAMLTFVFGFFIASQYTGMNSLALAEIPSEKLSTSTSITSTNQILAQSFGVAMSAVLLRIFATYTNHSAILSARDFHWVFGVLSVMTIFASILFIPLRPGDGAVMLRQKLNN